MEQKTIILLALYATVFFFVIYFRKYEWFLISILSLTCIIAVYLTNINIPILLLLTLLFAVVENICVYYGMWKYNTQYAMPFVPVWIYLAWAVSIIFIVYTLEDLK
jgi:uncharacterized membrane protein YoaT (DUF817 family)